MRARWLLEGAGAAVLFLLPYFYPLVLPSNLTIYHHHLPLTNLVRGLLLDMLGVVILVVAVIAIVSRLSPRWRQIGGACLAGFVFWRFIGTLLMFIDQWTLTRVREGAPINSRLHWAATIAWSSVAHPIAIGLVLLLATLAWWKPAISRFVVRAARLSLAGLSFSLLWIAPPLFSPAFVERAHHPRKPSVFAQSPASSESRIVWILFDELSYDLLFDHRPAGYTLPNLEKLHSTGISLGGLQPAGFVTERIVPSLLAGQPIDGIRSDFNGRLLYKSRAQDRWIAYDPDKTLFGLAHAGGWNPGVLGWYNPYCRIFRSVLDACSWEQDGELPIEFAGASEKNSAFANALILPYAVLTKLSGASKRPREESRCGHIREYQDIMRKASALIRNEDIRFVFLHLPVPHPPGFYDRHTHRLTLGGNYLDNLVLADDSVGSLMQEIDLTAAADRTTVIISSDHSWRIPMWRGAPGWTAEEERISQGRYEPRPVFLIHFPGESYGREIPDPLPELIEHDIIAGMLKHELKTPEDISVFVESSGRDERKPDQADPLRYNR